MVGNMVQRNRNSVEPTPRTANRHAVLGCWPELSGTMGQQRRSHNS